MAAPVSGIEFRAGGFDSDVEDGASDPKVAKLGGSLLQFMKKATKADGKSDGRGKEKKGKGRLSRSLEKGEKPQVDDVLKGEKVVLLPKKRNGVSLEKSSPKDGPIVELKAITNDLLKCVSECGLDRDQVLKVAELAGRYETVVMGLLLEQENLKGRLQVLGKGGLAKPGVPAMAGMVAAPVAASVSGPIPDPKPVPKPVETWSVVVRSKNAAVTPKEVVDKVVKDVAPSLGVRVHEVKPIRGGGAVIRAPSVAERDKIVENRKFSEVGLEVRVNEKQGARVVVQRVFSQISPDMFMGELYEKNLKDMMTLESFKRNVRLVVPPWKEELGATVTVILECNDAVVNTLMGNRRCYIMWHSFQVREYRQTYGCHRCLGHGHNWKECRMKGVVCRRCGQEGHMVRECNSAPSCRNCAFRGMPSGHLMLSDACPTHCAYVAQANARH